MRQQIKNYFHTYALNFLVAVLIFGSIFGIATYPRVSAFIGGKTGGGKSGGGSNGSSLGNYGQVKRQPTNVGGGNLAAYYPLDGNATDQVKGSGVANLTATGQSGGMVSSAGGKVGGAVQFNANQDRLEASSASTAAYGGNTSDFTLAAWVNLTSATFDPVLFSKYASDGSREFYAGCNTGCTSLVWSVYASNNLTSTAATKAFGGAGSGWHFVVIDYTVTDATHGTATIDVDNSQSPGTGSISLASQSSGSSKLMIGNYIATTSGQYYWKGMVDSVGHWNRILTAAEKTALYNGGSGHNYASLPATLKTNLQDWWDMEESGLNTRIDSIKTANTGTVSGATLVSGKFNQAYSFDGDDQITTTDVALSGNNVTFASWINIASAGATTCNTIIGKGDGNNGSITDYVFQVGWSGSGCTGGYADLFIGGSWHTFANTFTLDTWYHMVATYDGSNVKMYINGAQIGANSAETDAIYNSAETMRIGRQGTNTSSNNFRGSLDEVRIYNTALTASEVAALYAGSGPLPCDQTCVGWWKLDEASGTTATDSSGAGSTGTYTGSPTLNTEGIFGGAMKIDGTAGKYLDAGTANALNLSSNYFTISAWVKFTSTSGTQWLVARDEASNRGFAWGFISGKQTYSVGGSGSSGVGSTLSANTWYHVVITSERPSLTTNKFYLNGKLDHTATGASAVPNVTGVSTSIGERKYSGFEQAFNGSIDDVRIYNRVLSDIEIYSLYRSGISN